MARRNMIEHTDLEPVSCVYLFQLFPFAIAFDRTMTIRQVGEKSRELFGGEEMVGLPVETFFLIHRPRVAFTWDNVRNISSDVFNILHSVKVNGTNLCNIQGCLKRSGGFRWF